jgi:thiamine-phosphate pyrophosphorylase
VSDAAAAARLLPAGSAIVYRAFGSAAAAAEGRRLRAAARRGVLFFVGADAALAVRIRADGVHLPERSAGRSGVVRELKRRFLVTAAAHSLVAVIRARRSGVDAIVVSPVFASPSDPARRPMGALAFAALARQAGLPVYALGGVNAGSAHALASSRAVGIATVSAIAGAARVRT